MTVSEAERHLWGSLRVLGYQLAKLNGELAREVRTFLFAPLGEGTPTLDETFSERLQRFRGERRERETRNSDRIEEKRARIAAAWKRIEAGEVASDVLVRLGLLLAESESSNHWRRMSRADHPVPGWLDALLQSSLDAIGPNSPFDAITLFEGLSAIAGDRHLWLDFVFHRSPQDLPRDIPAGVAGRVLGDRADLADVLEARREEILDRWARWPASARLGLLEFLLEQDRVEPFAVCFEEALLEPSRTLQRFALEALERLDDAAVCGALRAAAASPCAERRLAAADLLPRLDPPDAHQLLTRLADDTCEEVARRARWAQIELDARTADPLPPIPPGPEPEAAAGLGEVVLQRLLLLHRREVEALRREREQLRRKIPNRGGAASAGDDGFAEAEVREYLAVLDGRARRGPLHAWKLEQFVFAFPEVRLLHAARSCCAGGFERVHPTRFARGWLAFSRWFEHHRAEHTDLRALQHVCAALGWPGTAVERVVLKPDPDSAFSFLLPADCLWPWFAERPALLWSLVVADAAVYREAPDWPLILDIIESFPKCPPELRGPAFDLALGAASSNRERMQRLLAGTPEAPVIALARLRGSSRKAEKLAAARWLGDLGDASVIPALRDLAESERQEDVLATLLDAVSRLGGTLDEILTPARLTNDAARGLAKTVPKAIAWFPFDALPRDLAWMDGSTVPLDVPRWWIVLAAKLKDPGNSLLRAFLDRLAPESSTRLSAFVLEAFLAEDVLPPTDLDLEKRVKQELQKELASARRSGISADVPSLRRALRRSYRDVPMGSAMPAKGILALCARVRWADVGPTVRRFLREHYPRWKQVDAIVLALGGSDDPEVIQWLLKLARGYRTRPVRERARAVVAAIGARQGWSPEELADRTVPTAGFGEEDIVELPFGARSFSASLVAGPELRLSDATGKALKSLPKPRKDDDPELAKDSTARLREMRSELKDVIANTSARLQEAMCTERTWTGADWHAWIRAHPIVGRLAERLLWEIDGQPVFPAEGWPPGTPDAALVRLAHGSRMDEATREHWQQRLAGREPAPLFEQVDRFPITGAFRRGETGITAWRGYLTDGRTLKGLATRLGYQPESAEARGVLRCYRREFPVLAMTAVLTSSGHFAGDPTGPVAIETLHFERSAGRRAVPVDLMDVPRVLLSECSAHIAHIAARTEGFDRDWEAKILL